MDELGVNVDSAQSWFLKSELANYVRIDVPEDVAQDWATSLGITVRRCYISDDLLRQRIAATGRTSEEVVRTVLPDAGSVMSGDFGEILVYLYQAADGLPKILKGAKKWQLKQDRTKSAPYSDVVQFILPNWPTASHEDAIVCAEVKTRATSSVSNPIANAIEDCQKDRLSRLTKTLIWLKDRAISGNHPTIEVEKVERFLNTTDAPSYTREFRAVAVICSSLIAEELSSVPLSLPDDMKLVLVGVPDLHSTYTNVFNAAANS